MRSIQGMLDVGTVKRSLRESIKIEGELALVNPRWIVWVVDSELALQEYFIVIEDCLMGELREILRASHYTEALK